MKPEMQIPDYVYYRGSPSYQGLAPPPAPPEQNITLRPIEVFSRERNATTRTTNTPLSSLRIYDFYDSAVRLIDPDNRLFHMSYDSFLECARYSSIEGGILGGQFVWMVRGSSLCATLIRVGSEQYIQCLEQNVLRAQPTIRQNKLSPGDVVVDSAGESLLYLGKVSMVGAQVHYWPRTGLRFQSQEVNHLYYKLSGYAIDFAQFCNSTDTVSSHTFAGMFRKTTKAVKKITSHIELPANWLDDVRRIAKLSLRSSTRHVEYARRYCEYINIGPSNSVIQIDPIFRELGFAE